MIVAKKEHNNRLAKREPKAKQFMGLHWQKAHSKRYIQQRKKEDGRRGRDIFDFGVCFY